MNRRILFAAVLTGILALTSLTCCGNKDSRQTAEPNIRIDAASAFYPMAVQIACNIPDENITEQNVKMVATSEGFSDISSGAADLLFTSIPNEQQKKEMAESGEEFEKISITTEPLVILVNRNNAVDSVSFEDLRSLYLKNDQNWHDYGGTVMPVTTYQLTEGNGSQTAFAQYIQGNQIGTYHREIQTMPSIIDAVAADQGGICYAFSSYYIRMYSSEDTKILKIDGKSFDDPEYPLTCEVSLYYRTCTSDSNVRRIADFLQTEDGRNLAEENSIYNANIRK